ncbi:NAD(P)/FAD-dependent oxidoreductase [Microbacterium marinilacus]|uniref:NAD(P)/FAD-dependent oxidoreductase n=1 Tax=Microbacterium marinilacus TaxID=415209 RepID=A0ABP7BQU8_9MICO|nr:NAD(P)/FAD-dependent oxidoreductase [Microbacterium marinilacus]MBY0689224.1 NAD(P)/FAD-dependent oxidoreductase [Microbacterium marinilacus]
MTSQTSPRPWDALVLGGGTAGLSAALMLGRARRRVLVVDSGSPRNRFASHMHGVLGDDGTPPSELLARGRSELARYDVEVREGAAASVEDAAAGLRLTLEDGTTHEARSVVVATGIVDELPDVPGLSAGWGTDVLHCPYCHGWEVRDRRLGVLAVGPQSLHQAALVRQWSDRVTLFSAAIGALDPQTEARLRSRGVRVAPSPVVETLRDGGRLVAVRTDDGRVTEVDAIFTAGTPRPRDGFLAPLGLDRAEPLPGVGAFLAVDPAGRTSHPRVWAAGNVVNPMLNVPMSMGAASLTGGAVNGALVEEDFDLAARSAS